MAIYILNMIMADEDGAIVFKIKNTKASEGIKKAISIINAKDKKLTLKEKLRNLDAEFKEYFSLEG